VAATLALGSLTFLWWASSDFETALMAATAVLIITCPCAFGLATPMAIAVAAGLGARHGILIKNGGVLEGLSSIDRFVLDKTGTLTEGRPAVTRLYAAGGGALAWRPGERAASSEHPAEALEVLAAAELHRERLAALAALERFSEHPLAAAVLRLCEEADIAYGDKHVDAIEVRPGFGIGGRVDGKSLVAGTAEWLRIAGVELDPALQQRAREIEGDGCSALHLGVAGRQVLVLGIEDRLRGDARQTIERLKGQGIRVTLLTGDRRRTAERISERLGGMEVIAEVLPEDKDRVIADLQRKGGRVAMVGDGVNDAPALVRADVGIAMGSGTDVSIASADIVLMSSELSKVDRAAALSRRTLSTIRQNIGISIAYNLIMVPLAMAALITPLVAAVSMPLSSLAVIGNSARIRTLFRRGRSA